MDVSKSHGRNVLRSALQRLGYKRKPRPFSEFVDFKETLKAAAKAGLSVGEYIERKHSTGLRTPLDETVDRMAVLGVFEGKVQKVCELGPGSGRYLDKTIARCRPRAYEIYETSHEWRSWLVKEYGVIARRSDGRTLGETESGSVDLVQAHKLFPGLPLLATLSYFREMARVVRSGGWVVFDVMTENCFSPENLQAWFDANPWDWAWAPHMCTLEYVLAMFAKEGISLVGSFQVALYPAVTECLVLRKALPGAGVRPK